MQGRSSPLIHLCQCLRPQCFFHLQTLVPHTGGVAGITQCEFCSAWLWWLAGGRVAVAVAVDANANANANANEVHDKRCHSHPSDFEWMLCGTEAQG